MEPPSETPKMWARPLCAASMTARMSSMRSSRVGMPAGRSDMPVPRLSKKSTRANCAGPSTSLANSGICGQSSWCERLPGHQTRSGPLPRTVYATWTSPLFA